MDQALARGPEGSDFLWSDNQIGSSDEGSGENMGPSPLSTGDAAWLGTASTTPFQPGQLSPVSSSVDMALDPSAVGMIPAATAVAPGADAWTAERADADQSEEQWDQELEDPLRVPKLEPPEEDGSLDTLVGVPAPGPSSQGEPTDPNIKPKRPRGRPRKHPIAPVIVTSKVTKGRSKTGCITCRKRKKKCDEAKPRCMNCEKNAVVCEGYHEKQLWKSGKERAEEERTRRESIPMITMQPIFHGVETGEDKVFWKHYITHFSNVLTVEGEAKNAFKDIILLLANEHQGLMHSILAVSSKHINFDEPYGVKLLQDNPECTLQSLRERSDYHHDAAMKQLYEDMGSTPSTDDPEYETILCARYGQMLCLLLQTRAEGNPRGEHRVHLQAYQNLIQQSPPEDPAFLTFITEFFQYHIFADDLFWHPETMTNRLASDDWVPPVQINPPRLIGVADGLFQGVSLITTIRNTIRSNMTNEVEPIVDYNSLFKASEIDQAIRQWTPQWPPGDNRERVALLYKQMMWVYLFRTIYPPNSARSRRSTMSALGMNSAPSMPGVPVRSASMITPSGGPTSPGYAGMAGTATTSGITGPRSALSAPSSRHPSRSASLHESDTMSQPATGLDTFKSGPAPVRRPQPQAPHQASASATTTHDRRITFAVEESLQILEFFKPSDPCQALLLIPCMIIGTACFDRTQQERMRQAVKAVKGYTGLRNCDRVLELLEELWSLMSQGEWLTVWDWQGVARGMGLDFLCT